MLLIALGCTIKKNHYYQFNQKPYSISPPSIFGYIATHMIVKIFYYHVPPWYWTIPGGDMIVKMFLLTCPPLVLFNTRGDMILKMFLLTCPPWYCSIPGGDMIVKTSLLSCPPLVLNNTRGGHVIEAIYSVFPCFWLILCLGFNQIDSNVNTVRLARRYWEILSSFFEIGVQYGPRACGPRSVLKPQFLRIQIVFPNTSSPDAQYSSIFA